MPVGSLPSVSASGDYEVSRRASAKIHKLLVIWVFPKIGGYPQIINSNRVFPYKPSILGYPYFWKHPYLSRSPFKDIPSLKLTVRPLKIDAWETILSFWVSAHFSGAFAVSFREGKNQNLGGMSPKHSPKQSSLIKNFKPWKIFVPKSHRSRNAPRSRDGGRCG